MTPPRRRRPLTADERRLWAEVARLVKPLPGRTVPAEAPPPPPPAIEAPAPGPLKPKAPVRTNFPRAAPPPVAPPAPGLDRKTSRALARGRRAVEGVLDLHGLTQAEAHARLIAFLTRAQAEERTLVLVVTGKGGAEPGDRGVLRRMTPHWLRLPALRPIVLGFEEAAPHRGGAGALYVRLKRPRA
jgi:DNA-nicking Smr family endonuclease